MRIRKGGWKNGRGTGMRGQEVGNGDRLMAEKRNEKEVVVVKRNNGGVWVE